MKLTPPSQIVFWISVALGVLGLLGSIGVIGALAGYAFWLVSLWRFWLRASKLLSTGG
jgi:hypothetical protein